MDDAEVVRGRDKMEAPQYKHAMSFLDDPYSTRKPPLHRFWSILRPWNPKVQPPYL